MGFVLAGFDAPAAASPIIRPILGQDSVANCAIAPDAAAADCLDAGAVLPVETSVPFLSLGGLNIGIIGGSLSAVSEVSSHIRPIPLPAAGWLLFAGLSALGVFGKRRRDPLPSLGRDDEPLSATLRDTVRIEFGTELRRVRLSLPGLPSLRELARVRWQLAFAPGRTSPVRPCGAAGHLYAAIAERAPPAARMTQSLSRPSGTPSRRPAFSLLERLGQAIGSAAFFVFDGSATKCAPARASPSLDFAAIRNFIGWRRKPYEAIQTRGS